MKYFLYLFLLVLIGFNTFGQQKPNGYSISQSKKFIYKGHKFKKGDTLKFNDNSLFVLKSIEKYPGAGVIKVYGSNVKSGTAEDVNVDHYLVGLNLKTQTIEYYRLDKSIENGFFILPKTD